MPRSAKKIPAGRNAPQHSQVKKGRGFRKSKARDVAMKMGDLRHSPIKTKSRFSRKAASMADVSRRSEPFDKSSLSGPRSHPKSRKRTATFSDVKRADGFKKIKRGPA